ncbi:Clavaminate synthase-like protein [Lentinus tigrinus ALCF2SS1-7]|uniref:Clavaminate synthase-like protein n=1 Tax=Lentinus tigrinus ALCF2SS1-6 TaxID=1328759 RepID=A0A5C2SCW0_9APHY|nr:Clavaminate synthase-like protein [Lentinus tigrinus ALCF2SS1-6]RPD73511.1 Clavaminate synthase-like protein [Lentinus tigrinus ALCF2SS1-7]
MSLTGVLGTFHSVTAEFCDPTTSWPNIQDLFCCDPGSAEVLVEAAASLIGLSASQQLDDTRSSLSEVLSRAHKAMASSGASGNRGWRRMYTDACLLLGFSDILYFSSSGDRALAYSAVSRLDHAIVIAGAPGEGRKELILDLICRVQSECLNFPVGFQQDNLPETTVPRHERSQSASLPSATRDVPRLDRPPSLSSFISRFCQQPFVLPAFLSDWPALNEHPWSSLNYLRKVAGPGRVVPVEIGSDYRSDDWTQQMIPWDEFLSNLEEQATGESSKPVLYLAQHSLYNQFPALKDDIFVPDYVYCDLDPPNNYPQYVPPANEERLVLNAWLGPVGTVSPAHTDPFFNFYGQVVGRKTIWLAPPEVSPHMYPYPERTSIASSDDSGEQPRNPAANNESPLMSNTSQVDVFLSTPEDIDASKSKYPDFWNHAVPTAMSVTLEPGDLLFFPPGWWHAMRSEETSFSVSMWF